MDKRGECVYETECASRIDKAKRPSPDDEVNGLDSEAQTQLTTSQETNLKTEPTEPNAVIAKDNDQDKVDGDDKVPVSKPNTRKHKVKA